MVRERQQALVLVALLYDGEGVAQVFEHFPKEQRALKGYADEWLKETPELRNSHILRRLKKMRQTQMVRDVAGIHPEWLAKAIASESSRVVRELLPLFPKETSEALLKLFPNVAISGVKKNNRDVDPELSAHLKRRFIDSVDASMESEDSPLFPLLKLSQLEWERLLTSVAYTELAHAFYGLKGAGYLAVLNRLSLDDAKGIQQIILDWESSHKPIDKSVQEKARLSLVSLEGERVKPEHLPRLLGEYLFARAIWKDRDLGAATRVAHLFPVSAGKRILATIKRHSGLNTARSVTAYQKRFLDEAKRLFQINR